MLGLENNCTRQIAGKDPMEIVTVKGFGSGLGALCIALAVREPFPVAAYIGILIVHIFVHIYFFRTSDTLTL